MQGSQAQSKEAGRMAWQALPPWQVRCSASANEGSAPSVVPANSCHAVGSGTTGPFLESPKVAMLH